MTNKVPVKFCLFLAFLIHLASSQAQPDQIIEIFRHGARAPLSDFDNTWPLSQYGELTPVGMRQHYLLGKALAERYPTLLGANATYNYSQVYVLSDSVPRCIQSVQSQLYGIYLGTGPGLREGYPSEVAVPPFQDALVQEIAASLNDSAALPYNMLPNLVEIVDNSQAFIFESDNATICPNSEVWQDQNFNDSDAKQFMVTFAETIKNLNQQLGNGSHVQDIRDLKAFGDVMMSNLIENMALPGNITDQDLITNLTHAFSWIELHAWTYQEVQRQTYSFGLLNATLEQLAAFRQGEDYNTVALFSGHDTNLYSILAALRVVHEDCVLDNFYSYIENKTVAYPLCYYPIFASNLVVEFYNATDAPYVKLNYNNEVVPLCNGQDTCSYEEFVAVLQNAVGNKTIQTYFESCGTSPTQMQALGYGSLLPQPNKTAETLMSFSKKSASITPEMMIICGLLVLVMVLVAQVVLGNRKYNKMVKEFETQRFFYSEINDVTIN